MSPAPVKGRIAGVALLGVAVIALVIGIVMTTTGEPAQRTAEQGPPGGSSGASASDSAPPATTTRASSSAAPTSAAGTAGASGSPAQPSAGGSPASGETTTVVPPPPTDDGNAGVHQAALPAGVRNVQVRVYNNSTIKGLAAQAAEDFRRAGYRVVEVGNYAGGIIPVTTAYYRPRTGEKAAAQLLGDQFDMAVKPRFPGIQQASPGVIVIVTQNYHRSPMK